MGLLLVETVFLPEKRQTQTRGRICQLEGPFAGLSGALLSGYQIHMGRTRRLGGNPFARIQDRTDAAAEPADDGCICGNVCGTYVHGLFDTPQVAQAVVGMLAQRAGISTADIHARDMTAYKNAQYDLLAKTVRDNLDMDFIYRIVRAGL